MSTKPQHQPDRSRDPATAPAWKPGCDEFSGGGGSATDTRHRGLPGDTEGDCARVGNDLTDEKKPAP
ncbi:MAG TPA: hypothetical protein VD995_17210 [Azospirillum sp.]|nr:hypothetical protein [Azospirillum sp.]